MTGHPPAWYPDPRDVRRLRRWDGKAWTSDLRPFPPWLQALGLAEGPRRRPPRRQVTGLWLASFACVVSALTIVAAAGPPRPSTVAAETIGDRRFAPAASDACQQVDGTATPVEVEEYERLVDEQEALVDELRRLPVAPPDQPAVDRWLAHWDAWTTSGRRYVQALAAGDEARARAASEQSRSAKAAIDGFSVANGIGSCVLFRTR